MNFHTNQILKKLFAKHFEDIFFLKMFENTFDRQHFHEIKNVLLQNKWKSVVCNGKFFFFFFFAPHNKTSHFFFFNIFIK